MSDTADSSPPAARRFERQVVVVTGAGRGIGLFIAEAFAREGASVVLADVSAADLEPEVQRLQDGYGPRILGVDADLSKEAGALALRDRTQAAFGNADVLVNNAGGGVILPFLSHTPETLHATIDRNLWTTLWCTRAFLPAMLAAGYGRIVNLGADSVRNGLADHAAYNAAKAECTASPPAWRASSPVPASPSTPWRRARSTVKRCARSCATSPSSPSAS